MEGRTKENSNKENVREVHKNVVAGAEQTASGTIAGEVARNEIPAESCASTEVARR